MPSKIGQVSQDFLVNAALPKHGSTYTVISHKYVIDTVKEELKNNNFFIEEESYRATSDAGIAVGLYKLTHKSDPELSMAFAWTNSYNKQVKFKAVVGAISSVNNSLMILGEQGAWVRKHTGTADLEAKEQIVNQVKKADVYYKQLIADRDIMKAITFNKRKQSELLGILFADYGLLEVSGASSVRQQMIKPGFIYQGGSETLWAFYNHVTHAIQENHPKTWLEEQRMLHYIITNEYGLAQIPTPDVSNEAPVELYNNEQEEVSNTEEIEAFANSQMPDEVLEDLAKNAQQQEAYENLVNQSSNSLDITDNTEKSAIEDFVSDTSAEELSEDHESTAVTYPEQDATEELDNSVDEVEDTTNESETESQIEDDIDDEFDKALSLDEEDDDDDDDEYDFL